jgi:hypothetical protein
MKKWRPMTAPGVDVVAGEEAGEVVDQPREK